MSSTAPICSRAGASSFPGWPPSSRPIRSCARHIWDCRADAMDIYLVEALLNGLLLGGVLALLALGLNLIFGVIDVVWIAYPDLVMCAITVASLFFVFFHCPLPPPPVL